MANTKVIKAYIADPLGGQKPVPVVIELTEKLPKFNSKFSTSSLYQSQAEEICKALREALPQGVFDRLWIELAKTKISLYRGLIDEE